MDVINLKSMDWYYRAEGNANLVIAIQNCNQIIRISKSTNYSTPSCKQEYIKFIEYLTPILGKFHQPQKILYLTETDARKLEEKLHKHRPKERLYKSLQHGEVLLCYDYTYLNTSEDVYCIEIKLKQGWVPKCDQKKLCPYCLHQFYKLSTGVITKINEYCPLDLYSGNTIRMKHALNALLENPQNNFKILKNGSTIYDLNNLDISKLRSITRSTDDLLELIIKMLLGGKIGSTAPSEPGCQYLWDDPGLPEGCVLDLLYKIQRLNKLGITEMLRLYNKIAEIIPEDILQDLNVISLKERKEIDEIIKENLIGYLMFSTFRDCSVMLTFHRSKHRRVNSVVLGDGTFFETSVRLTDLDPKGLSVINKHWVQMNEALKAHKLFNIISIE